MRIAMAKRTVVEQALLVGASVAVVVVLAALTSGYVFRTFRNVSIAMEPTLPVAAYMITLPARTPARTDIVTFRHPRDTTLVFAKRIVAVGGDTVEIRNKKLFVNSHEN